jgi:hypothetical protein
MTVVSPGLVACPRCYQHGLKRRHWAGQARAALTVRAQPRRSPPRRRAWLPGTAALSGAPPVQLLQQSRLHSASRSLIAERRRRVVGDGPAARSGRHPRSAAGPPARVRGRECAEDCLGEVRWSERDRLRVTAVLTAPIDTGIADDGRPARGAARRRRRGGAMQRHGARTRSHPCMHHMHHAYEYMYACSRCCTCSTSVRTRPLRLM